MNSAYAIYDKTTAILAEGALLDITGCANSFCVDAVFDPQIIWDADTSRFYYERQC
jgi:hypothetical protein